jgi:quercetin dioxygenase-like cupin family protein
MTEHYAHAVNDATGPHFFLLDEIEWPDELKVAGAPRELVEQAQRSGARRKFLARGEGGFFSQYSEFPAGFTVPMHSHDHNEVILLLDGSCTMLGADGPTLRAGDSMVLIGGYEYGFTAGADGMRFVTIRTGKAEVTITR